MAKSRALIPALRIVLMDTDVADHKRARIRNDQARLGLVFLILKDSLTF